jgi:hypothetical protein
MSNGDRRDGMRGLAGRRPRLVVLILLVAQLGVVGCGNPGQSGPDRQTRVDQAFQRHADAVVEKEGGSAVPTGHLLAGSDQLAGGTDVTLWVTDPAAAGRIKSRCFYLDLEDRGGAGSGFGGCGAAGDQVTLSRSGEIVIGTVGKWPAPLVRITRGGPATEVAVIGGYFLVPQSLTGDADAGYSVLLVGAGGEILGAVHDLIPPASATPVS